MKKYKVKLAKTKFVEVKVNANNKKEAIEKALERNYFEVLEDEYFLPSTEWEAIETRKINE